MYRRRHYLIFGSAVLLAVVILNLPDRAASRFKLAISGLFLPLMGLSHSADRLAEKSGNTVVPRADLLRENEQLRKENQELRAQLMQAQEVWRENDRLRQALTWQKEVQWKLRPARVIGRDPANWWQVIHLNAGEREGIRPNYPVLTAAGLVGRTAQVGSTHSQAVLLGDPKCRVSALVPEANDSGVVSADTASLWNPSYVTLGFLSRPSDLKPGQRIITSGLGGIFPRGILIGHIVDLHSVDGLYPEARVKLAVNMSALEEVWVLIP